MTCRNDKQVGFRATVGEEATQRATSSLSNEVGHQGLFRLGWARNVTTHNKEIIVADHVNEMVKLYNTEGLLLDCLSTRKTLPLGVVATSDGRIFVADNSMVKVFALNNQQLWQKLYEFPPYIDCCGVDEKPELVSMASTDDKSKILLGTQFPDYVTVYDSKDGSPISEESSIPLGICPSYIACGSSGRIIVSSYGVEDKVEIINADGELYCELHPPEGVQSWVPSGVCFDRDGYEGQGCYYVANWAVVDRGIYCYSTTGQFLRVISHDLYNPNGLAMDEQNNRLLVADDRSVKIFNLRTN